MYSIYQLANKITVVTEYIEHVHSVSIGVFVYSGSRHESAELSGISHLIEHMLFKGTHRRSAKDIAEEFDSVGGHLNAYTTKEYTCYYAKILDTHIGLAVDILSDMLLNSKLDDADLELERRVVLEEIRMSQDMPEDLVHDMVLEAAWGEKCGLGSLILGRENTLSCMTSDVLKDYMRQVYTPDRIVIAVAGNFDKSELRMLLEDKFGKWHRQGTPLSIQSQPFGSNILVKRRDIEQIHICLGFEGPPAESSEVYALMAFNNVFGNGMSSRLFQRVREEKGLAYSIYSYLSSFVDTGIFVIVASMTPQNFEQVLNIVFEEIDRAKSEALSEDTLYKAKEQLKGNYILGLENVSSRMQSIGRSMLLKGRVRTPEQITERIERIDAKNVSECVNALFNYDKMASAVIGNIDKTSVYSLLKR